MHDVICAQFSSVCMQMYAKFQKVVALHINIHKVAKLKTLNLYKDDDVAVVAVCNIQYTKLVNYHGTGNRVHNLFIYKMYLLLCS